MTAEERRLELQAKLKATLGSENVYFEPPTDVRMNYPAIVYERNGASKKSADNIAYSVIWGYQVTYIDQLPNSDMIDALIAYPYSSFSRHFATSGLNHDVFVIYH